MLKSNITLGEVKAYCTKRIKENNNLDVCKKCEFYGVLCDLIPAQWPLEEATPPVAKPDYEDLFHKAEVKCRELAARCEDNEILMRNILEENKKLRIIVSAVETVLGRPFEL